MAVTLDPTNSYYQSLIASKLKNSLSTRLHRRRRRLASIKTFNLSVRRVIHHQTPSYSIYSTSRYAKSISILRLLVIIRLSTPLQLKTIRFDRYNTHVQFDFASRRFIRPYCLCTISFKHVSLRFASRRFIRPYCLRTISFKHVSLHFKVVSISFLFVSHRFTSPQAVSRIDQLKFNFTNYYVIYFGY